MTEKPQSSSVTPSKYAALIERLRHAITTATNDDISELRSEKRARHIERLEVMHDAIEALAALTPAQRTELCPTPEKK